MLKKVINSQLVRKLEERPLVDYFTLERFAEEYKKHSWSIPKKYTIKKNGESYVYVLDSAVHRSICGNHFSAYITCNGKSYGFDGESFARMTPFEWKKNLNKDIAWRFAEQYDTYFKLGSIYQGNPDFSYFSLTTEELRKQKLKLGVNREGF